MSNSNTVPEVQSLQDLIKEYYKTQIHSEIDTDHMQKVLNFNLAVYDTPHPSTNTIIQSFTTREEEINYLLKGSNFVDSKRLMAFTREFILGGVQQMVSKIPEMVEQGYTVVTSEQYNLHAAFKSNYLCMRKPQEHIDTEREEIQEGIQALFKELSEIQRKNKMDVNLATEWAKEQQANQEQALNDYVITIAKKEALQQIKSTQNIDNYTMLIDELEDQDYVFFNYIKERMNTADNDTVSELLTHCDFVKVRRTLSDGKQTSLFVKDFIANDPTFDYKSIQV